MKSDDEKEREFERDLKKLKKLRARVQVSAQRVLDEAFGTNRGGEIHDVMLLRACWDAEKAAMAYGRAVEKLSNSDESAQ